MSETTVSLKRGPIAEGFHYGRLTEFQQKTGPKADYWEFMVTIEEQTPDNGREVPLRITLSPAGRWKLDQFLDAVEAPGEGEGRGSQFLGKLIKLHVTHTEYDGRVRGEVDDIFPPGIVDPQGGKLPEASPLGPSPDLVSGAEDDIPF